MTDITLFGNVSREPRLNTMQDGRKVLNINMGDNGLFWNVVVFDNDNSPLASNIASKTFIGTRIMVSGYFRQPRPYRNRNGQTVYPDKEVVAQRIHVLEQAGEGRLIAAIRRNMDQPEVKKALDWVIANVEPTIYQDGTPHPVVIPDSWEVLNRTEQNRPKSRSKKSDMPVDMPDDDDDDDDDDEIPF